MYNRFTYNIQLITTLTFCLLGVLLACLLAYDKISANPANSQFKLTLPALPVSPTRNWGIDWPVSEEDIQCMALNIYFEARSEPVKAQYAVADVVMHRAMHYNYPNTICGVIKDGVYPPWNSKVPYKWRCSFTWHCDRKSDSPNDVKALVVAQRIAHDVIMSPSYDPEVDYALYYHATSVNPYWSSQKVYVKQVGSHLFYM